MGIFLYGRLANLPKDEYEIPSSIRISEEGYGIVVRKGDRNLLAIVNETIEELNKSGEAKRIFGKWLQRRASDGAPVQLPGGPQAVGAVTRTTSTEGGFIVLAISGYFRPDAEVRFFDPQGEPLGRGKVRSVYGDEVYVDAVSVPKGVVARPRQRNSSCKKRSQGIRRQSRRIGRSGRRTSPRRR